MGEGEAPAAGEGEAPGAGEALAAGEALVRRRPRCHGASHLTSSISWTIACQGCFGLIMSNRFTTISFHFGKSHHGCGKFSER